MEDGVPESMVALAAMKEHVNHTVLHVPHTLMQAVTHN
jgi:hypothetical protein